MNTAKDFTLLANEWAGLWTETALTILKRAGLQRISVEMEIEVWKTLESTLQAELQRQASLCFLPLVSLSDLMERVLRKTTLLVAQRLEPQTVTDEFEDRLSQLAEVGRRVAREHGQPAGRVRRPVMRESFAEPGRSVAARGRRAWAGVGYH